MSTAGNDPEKPQIEVMGDDDWKAKVKAEDARLDREREQAKEAGSAAVPETGDSASVGSGARIAPAQLPPASIDVITQLFISQAMNALGLIPGPDGKTQIELALARHFIDLLAVIQAKTKGNLTGHESNFIESALHELRMIYLDVSKNQTA